MLNKLEAKENIKLISFAFHVVLYLLAIPLACSPLHVDEAINTKQVVPQSREDILAYLTTRYGNHVAIQKDRIYDRIRTIQFYEDGIAEMTDDNEIRRYAKKLIRETSDFTKVDPDQLVEEAISISDRKIQYSSVQSIAGIFVENSGVGVEILKKERGRQKRDHVSIGGMYFPDIALSTVPRIKGNEAVDIGDAYLVKNNPNYEHLKSVGDVTLLRSPKLVIYPKEILINNKPSGYECFLAWRLDYQIRSAMYIDAHSGIIVSKGIGSIP